MVDKKHIGYKAPAFKVDVEKGRLRLFAKSIGQTDPIYTDETVAQANGHPSIPVMPTFFFCLEMEQADPYAWFRELGVPTSNALHAEQSFNYNSLAYAGDVLNYQSEIVDIYEKKNGALEFIAQDNFITNQLGQQVADFRRTIVIQAR